MLEEDDRVQIVTLFTRVLLQLALHPRISQETLARRLDVTMRTAQRHLTLLEEQGYIRVNRVQKPFHYTVDWSKPCPHLPWMRLVLFHPAIKEYVSVWGQAILDAELQSDAPHDGLVDSIKQLLAGAGRQEARVG